MLLHTGKLADISTVG